MPKESGRHVATVRDLPQPAWSGTADRARGPWSPGQPLDAAARAFMEPRLGHDFSGVRVHADAKAADSARAMTAEAYTVHRDIVFGNGRYAPASLGGRRLLAHELVHVVQQAGAHPSGGNITVNEPGGEDEREAHQLAEAVVSVSTDTSDPSRARAAPATSLTPRHPQANLALLQRQHLQTASGRYVGDLPGAAIIFAKRSWKQWDRLHALWSMPNADYAAEYPAVSAIPARSTVPIATIPKTLAALRRNEDPTLNQPVAQQFLDLTLSAEVGRGQPNNKSDIYGLQDVLHRTWMLSNPDYTAERTAVNSSSGPRVPDAQIPKTIAGLAAAKAAIVGGTFRRDVFAGAHAVTPAEHAAVEGVLRPGATVTPGVGGAPPVISNPPQ